MKKGLNEEVIFTIRKFLPPDENIVSFLSNSFFWGKESIYRRLRGEIPFTYEEIVTVALKLGFSIDNIIGLKQSSKRVLFNLILHESENPEDLYYLKIQDLNRFFAEVRRQGKSKNIYALNYVPHSFSIYLELLTKFSYYKWMHQTQDIDPECTMSDLVLPQKMVNLRKAWMNEDRSSGEVSYILDNNVILSTTRDIDYFYKRNLISDEELELLRDEMIILINGMEHLAKTGITVSGAKAYLYLSFIDIPTSHAYFEYNNNACCHVQVHGIDVLQSYSPEACQAQKEWLELLKRYSILITKSGEKERFEYFNKQREYVMGMGNAI